jgi:hypothetical protein
MDDPARFARCTVDVNELSSEPFNLVSYNWSVKEKSSLAINGM